MVLEKSFLKGVLMKKLLLAVAVLFVGVQCFTQNQSSKFDFSPDDLESVADFSKMCPQDLFKDPNIHEEDLRSCDLSKYDLSNLPRSFLEKLTFDDKTIWPKKMPEWLDIHKIYQISKTPGLRIRDLHKQGIMGRGVNIAIIDKNLGPHQEYNQNIIFYKNFEKANSEADMHGAAVASIAVGKSVGVAPGAKVYYVGANFSQYYKEKGPFNARIYTEPIEYLLELNKTLPEKDKIFVIAMSRGFNETDYGRENFLKALDKAKKQGILVLSTNNVAGINRRDYYVNPQNRDSFVYAPVWDKELFNTTQKTSLAVPNDYRVVASPTGEKDYVSYADGGLSWAVPYLAGIAALAKQVKPDLTPQEFLDVARKTAQRVQVKTKDGKKTAMIDTFVNPQALIKELKNRKVVPNEQKENIESLGKGLKGLPQKVKSGN